MAINKNFVVKNGFEVNQTLILADADTNKVGIGTSQPKYLLDVAGGIGVTDVYAVGFATFTKELNVGIDGAVLTALGIGSVGVGTAMPSYLLDIRSPVSTGQTALYVQGDVRITGDLNVDDISLDDATVQDLTIQQTLFVGDNGGAGIATIKKLNVSGLTTTNELITYGISTFRNYARFIDGQQLYFGDGSDLSIYHDGSNSYITDQGTGNLYLQSTAGSINILTNTSESAFVANQNGSVELYYDNAKKFETLSTGSTVTGTLFTNQISSSGVSTASAYYVNGTQVINNSRQLQNIVSLDATTTSTIEAAIANAPNTFSDLTVTGVSTLGVTSATQLTSQNLNVTGVATIATLNATNVTISGAAVTNFTVYNNLSVGGVSTFTNGPVLIGSATSTGTALQRLQVSGGSYFSGSVGISTTNPIQQFQVGSGTTVVVIDGNGDLGIAITNPTSKLHVVGDGIFTGVVTATTLNSTTGTIANLSGTNVNYSGVVTATTLNSTTGTITNLSGTNVNYSGVGTITTLNSTTGTIANLSGTNVNYSGVGTVVNLRSTTLNNTGIGTITTLNSTTGTIANLSGTNVNYSGISTASRFVSTISTGTSPFSIASTTVVTNLNTDLLDGQHGTYYIDLTNSTGTLPDARFTGTYTGASFNSTGIATFASFSGSGASLTSLNATNLLSGTLNNARLPSSIDITNLNVSGITTLGAVRVSSGIITAASGIVTYYGDGSGLINTPPGSPAGSANQVQYNNGIAFAGSPNLTHDGTTTRIFAGIVTTISGTNLNYTGIGTITNLSGNSANYSGIVTSSSFVVSGGTSNQFLKANGSTDSTSYTSTGKAIAMAMVFGS